jgi:hypothetical protein
MSARSFTDELDRVLRWAPIEHAVVGVTEGWARRVLGISRKIPDVYYRGVRLTCIGSPAWRARQMDPGPPPA